MLYIYEKSGRKRLAKEVVCENCGKKFLKAKRFIKTASRNFCSKKCSFEGHRVERVKLICSLCEKVFERSIYKLKVSRHGIYFCSRKCKDEGQKLKYSIIDIWPKHYGIYTTYRAHALEYYGKRCEICGYYEHPEILQVHHIDANRKNNKIENLIVLCPNHHWALTIKKAILLEDRTFRWLIGDVAKREGT